MTFLDKWPEGTHIPVVVNGREYDTVISGGVQRFVGNPIVAAFVSGTTEAYNVWLRVNPLNGRNWAEAPFTLNNISYEVGNPYTLDQLIEFSTLHGYSVSGMCDLSFMDDVFVENPVWED